MFGGVRYEGTGERNRGTAGILDYHKLCTIKAPSDGQDGSCLQPRAYRSKPCSHAIFERAQDDT